MRRAKSSFLVCFMTAILVVLYSLPVFAAGTTTIYVSAANIAVGDTTDVTIEATESGNVTVKYTSSVMSLESCSASGYSASGNTITFKGKSGTLKFKGTTEGTASIIVSSSAASGSSTTITVGSSATTKVSDTTAKPENQSQAGDDNNAAVTTDNAAQDNAAVDVTAASSTPQATAPNASVATGMLNANGNFDIAGVEYVASERFTDKEILSGFKKTSVKIGSKNYNELSNGILTLVYLKPASNTQGSGEFYVFDQASGSVSKFMYVGTSSYYVMLTTPTEIPCATFMEQQIDLGQGQISAYTIPGSEFVYFFGADTNNVTGWFAYDTKATSIARADLALLSMSSTQVQGPTVETVEQTEEVVAAPAEKKLDKYRIVIAVLVLIVVILAFALIKKLLSEDVDDEDGEIIFDELPARSKTPMRRSRFARNDDDKFDDDDDEFDNDDDEFDDDDDEFDDDDDEFDDDEDGFDDDDDEFDDNDDVIIKTNDRVYHGKDISEDEINVSPIDIEDEDDDNLYDDSPSDDINLLARSSDIDERIDLFEYEKPSSLADIYDDDEDEEPAPRRRSLFGRKNDDIFDNYEEAVEKERQEQENKPYVRASRENRPLFGGRPNKSSNKKAKRIEPEYEYEDEFDNAVEEPDSFRNDRKRGRKHKDEFYEDEMTYASDSDSDDFDDDLDIIDLNDL